MLKTIPAYEKYKQYSEQDLEDAANLIEACLKWLPSQRVTALEALEMPFCKD